MYVYAGSGALQPSMEGAQGLAVVCLPSAWPWMNTTGSDAEHS